MARKQQLISNQRDDRLSMIMRAAYAMRLPSIEAYQQWCFQQGFSTQLNKTQRQLDREYQHYVKTTARNVLQQHKRENNLQHIVKKLYSKEMRYADVTNEVLCAISAGFQKIQNRRLLRDVLCRLDESSKLLGHVCYVEGVINFVAHYGKWIRPIADWQPKTRNADRQFASLARHLFAKYPIPEFMDSVWYRGNTKAQGWFIHIGIGNNIRTASSLPIPLTKKMAHHFLQAPSHYDVKAAFRWAQIHALGGNKRVADAIAATRIARQFKDDTFWLSVLRFFIDNPFLDASHYQPIVDYIWNQKYEPRIVFVERGVTREEPPAQPNFTIRGRTPATLLRQVDQWHDQLGKETRGRHLQWVKSRYPDYRYIEGQVENRNMKIWTIRELLSHKELVAEGRKQNHCVATYARSCHSGGTSIWTMDLQTSSSIEKCVTIELHFPTKTLRQVRGQRNRLAKKSEMDVIARWANKEGFRVASYAAG